jgi:SSS family solute:Na+ symporter
MTKPKPVAELQGLVYGMANVDEEYDRRVHRWYESPKLMAAFVLAGAALFTILLW